MRLLFILILALCSVFSFGQPIVNRSNSTITVQDQRFSALYNLLIPKYADTTAANVQIGIDSCGAIVFTYDVMNTWIRKCSPKRWEQSGELVYNIYTTDSTIYAPEDSIRRVTSINRTKLLFRSGEYTTLEPTNIAPYYFGVLDTISSNTYYDALRHGFFFERKANLTSGVSRQYTHGSMSMFTLMLNDTATLNPTGGDAVTGTDNTLKFIKQSDYSGRSVVLAGLLGATDPVSATLSNVLFSGSNIRVRGALAGHTSYLNIPSNDTVDFYMGNYSRAVSGGKKNTVVDYWAGLWAASNLDSVYAFVNPGSNARFLTAGDVQIGLRDGYPIPGQTINADRKPIIGQFNDPSAILQVNSTTKGALIAPMTPAQRLAISAPATGLMVYDTDSLAYFQYNGSAWEKMGGGGGSSAAQGIFANSLIDNYSDSLRFVQVITTARPDSAKGYGNSNMQNFGVVEDSGMWRRNAVAWGLVDDLSESLGGSGMFRATMNANQSQYPGARVLIGLEAGLNDLRRSGSNLLTNRKIVNGAKAIWVNHRLGNYVQAGGSGTTRTGTWSSFDCTATGLGGKSTVGAVTATANDSVSYVSTGTTVAFSVLGSDGTKYSYTDSFRIYLDGVLMATESANFQTDGISDTFFDNGNISLGFYFTGLDYGSHRVTLMNREADTLIVDYFGNFKPAGESFAYVLYGVPYMTAAAYTAEGNILNDGIIDIANASLDSMFQTLDPTYAQFFIETSSILDVATDYQADGIHWNIDGHRKLSDSTIAQIAYPTATITPQNGTIFYNEGFYGVENNEPNRFAYTSQIPIFGRGLDTSLNSQGTVVVTNNLSTGIDSAQQTIIGSTQAGGDLLLMSTIDATPGMILLGNASYPFDVANGFLGFNKSAPGAYIDIVSDLATKRGILFKGAAAQTGLPFEVHNSSNVRQFVVDPSGGIGIGGNLANFPPAGGLEIFFTAGESFIQSYNRTTSLYVPLRVTASTMSFRPNGTERIAVNTAGQTTFSANVIINNAGTAVNTRIAGDNETNLFFADGTNDRIGIKTASPLVPLHVNGTIQSGIAGTTIGGYLLSGNTSGTISILPQAAAGTYNFNLPTTAGSSGQALLSAGGGASPMTFGTLGVGAGGTGLTGTPTNGQLLIGNGTGFTLASLTSTGGTITVTPGAGTLNVDIPASVSSAIQYTPTFVESNIGTCTANRFFYRVNNNQVKVTGKISTTGTTVAASATIRVTLPAGFTQAFDNDYELVGHGSWSNGTTTNACYVEADPTNEEAIITIEGVPSDGTVEIWISFTYEKTVS